MTDLTQPNNGHGTFVAGIIAAQRNNSLGVVGIASTAWLYSYMVGNCQGQLTTTEVANALQAAMADGVDVVNMSLGASSDDPSVRDAIVQALNSNIILVAAAGNNSQDIGVHPMYPAAYSANYQGIISVAASDPYGNLASFSNFSSTYVNIIAPGQGVTSICIPAGGICSAFTGSTYGTGNGTSFAAPMVTGAVALTLGALKFKGQAYTAAGVQDLVTIQGARVVSALSGQIANGAFLDFNLLAGALGQAQNLAGDQVVVNSETLTFVNGVPSLSVSFSWNLTNVPAGTQLGLFNTSSGCNYTSPCLIQGLTYSSNTGSATIQLTQNELALIMADPKDPNFKLPISIAFYYPIKDSSGNVKNNPGIVAQATYDLRNQDGSLQLGSTALQGAVTNIRMDMQYFYVQGWACLPGSNAAATVSLLQSPSGTPLTISSVYQYPWMFPHSGIADGDFFVATSGNQGISNYGNVSLPISAPFIVQGTEVVFKGKTSYPSGLEANPQLMAKCSTFTASHGFELIVPISQIASSALSETSFQVSAALSGHSLILQDPSGNSTFQFPDVNFQTQVQSSLAVVRDAANYTISGSVCSSSPSPIEVEASFTTYGFQYTMFGCTICGTSGGYGGMVTDPSLGALGLEEIDYAPNASPNLTTKTSTLNPQSTDSFTTEYLKYSSHFPNTTVSTANFPDPMAPPTADFTSFINQVNSRGLTQIGTGLPVTFYWQGQSWPSGKQEVTDVAAEQASRSKLAYQSYGLRNGATSFNGYKYGIIDAYWDWYDVGDAFAQASSLVGYSFDPTQPAGAYIANHYGVTSVIRETKPFETPLSGLDTVLGHAPLQQSGACAAGFTHVLNPLVIANYPNYAPLASTKTMGFFTSANQVFNPPTSANQVQSAMQRVPINLRFFQDGKLILHVESEADSSFYPIKYPFQNASY